MTEMKTTEAEAIDQIASVARSVNAEGVNKFFEWIDARLAYHISNEDKAGVQSNKAWREIPQILRGAINRHWNQHAAYRSKTVGFLERLEGTVGRQEDGI
jgi:hypothetical protein